MLPPCRSVWPVSASKSCRSDIPFCTPGSLKSTGWKTYRRLSKYFPSRCTSRNRLGPLGICSGGCFDGGATSLRNSSPCIGLPVTLPETTPSTPRILAKALCAMMSGIPRKRASRVDATAFWDGASSPCCLKNTVRLVPTFGFPIVNASFVLMTSLALPVIDFPATADDVVGAHEGPLPRAVPLHGLAAAGERRAVRRVLGAAARLDRPHRRSSSSVIGTAAGAGELLVGLFLVDAVAPLGAGVERLGVVVEEQLVALGQRDPAVAR